MRQIGQIENYDLAMLDQGAHVSRECIGDAGHQLAAALDPSVLAFGANAQAQTRRFRHYSARVAARPAGRSWASSRRLASCQVKIIRSITVRLASTAITHSTGAMRSNSAPMISSTTRSGRSMNPTLHCGMVFSARARV